MLTVHTQSSNNGRTDLVAAIDALKALPLDSPPVEIVSNSQYLVEGMTKWIGRWMANGWRRPNGHGLVKNRDLWETLAGEASKRTVTWTWAYEHAEDVPTRTDPVDVPSTPKEAGEAKHMTAAFWWHPQGHESWLRLPTKEFAARLMSAVEKCGGAPGAAKMLGIRPFALNKVLLGEPISATCASSLALAVVTFEKSGETLVLHHAAKGKQDRQNRRERRMDITKDRFFKAIRKLGHKGGIFQLSDIRSALGIPDGEDGKKESDRTSHYLSSSVQNGLIDVLPGDRKHKRYYRLKDEERFLSEINRMSVLVRNENRRDQRAPVRQEKIEASIGNLRSMVSKRLDNIDFELAKLLLAWGINPGNRVCAAMQNDNGLEQHVSAAPREAESPTQEW